MHPIPFQGKVLETRNLRAIKSEIRILGIDDGKFVPHTSGRVIVVGVIFRGGSWLDGVIHTNVGIDGLDATEQIASMITSSSHCRQLRLVMLNGITFAGFNVVDIEQLHLATKLPIIAVTRDKPDLASIRSALNNLPENEERWKMILAAGEICEACSRGKKIYMGLSGISKNDAQEIIDLTSTRASFPEPLRVAHLVASGVS